MSYWRLFYHVTWSTKAREPLIEQAIEASIYNVMVAKATDLGGRVYAVGGVEDHVHMVVSIPPRVALADFVAQVKGSSSHFANHELGLPYRFQWQSEYGIVSFGEKQLDYVVRYVRNQREHHAQRTVVSFLEHDTDVALADGAG